MSDDAISVLVFIVISALFVIDEMYSRRKRDIAAMEAGETDDSSSGFYEGYFVPYLPENGLLIAREVTRKSVRVRYICNNCGVNLPGHATQCAICAVHKPVSF